MIIGKRKSNIDPKLLEAGKKILDRKNENFNDWAENILRNRKLEIMSDQDKEWADQEISKAVIQLLISNQTNV